MGLAERGDVLTGLCDSPRSSDEGGLPSVCLYGPRAGDVGDAVEEGAELGVGGEVAGERSRPLLRQITDQRTSADRRAELVVGAAARGGVIDIRDRDGGEARRAGGVEELFSVEGSRRRWGLVRLEGRRLGLCGEQSSALSGEASPRSFVEVRVAGPPAGAGAALCERRGGEGCEHLPCREAAHQAEQESRVIDEEDQPLVPLAQGVYEVEVLGARGLCVAVPRVSAELASGEQAAEAAPALRALYE